MAKNKLDSALMALEQLLQADGYDSQSAYISRLRKLCNSSTEPDQSEFRKLITTEKFIWLGMGTIADIVLSTDERTQNSFKLITSLRLNVNASGSDRFIRAMWQTFLGNGFAKIISVVENTITTTHLIASHILASVAAV